MKTLFLVRHAKSDWDNPLLLDIERPLNERGYSNANSMSKTFKSKPDLIITSPAVRAISTALIFARNLNYPANNIIVKQELYESSVKDYYKVIQQQADSFQTVMLFAHNPTISDLANKLSNALPMEMPTCAIAGIEFNCDSWKELKQGQLVLFEYPKKMI